MFFKRMFDLSLGFLLLLLLSPILLTVSLALLLFQGRPILFCQDRPGRDGKIFKMYKFRTMTEIDDSKLDSSQDFQRITPIGRFLRESSIDELPEILNILKGEMSFVGPRPLLVKYLDLYSKEEFRRHNVLPGITGWAQIHGRNSLDWKKRFEYDIWYVDHWNFFLDIKILFLTVAKVLKKEGVNQANSVTMEEFKGHHNKPKRQ